MLTEISVCIGLLIGLIWGSRSSNLTWVQIGKLLGIALLSMPLVFNEYKNDIHDPDYWRKIISGAEFIFFFSYTILAAAFYHASILPRTNEASILIMTVNFLYLLFINEWTSSLLVLAVTLPVTTLVIVSALTNIRLGKKLRFSLGFWFLGISFILVCRQCYFMYLHSKQLPESEEFLNALLTMTEFSLVGCSILVLVSIFISFRSFMIGKHEPFDKWKRRLKAEVFPTFISRVSPEQLPPQMGYAVLFLHGGPILFNAVYEVVSPEFAIAYGISIIPVVTSVTQWFNKSRHAFAESS